MKKQKVQISEKVKEQIPVCSELGKKAFLNDQKCIPYHDADLMKIIDDLRVPMGETNRLFTAWLKAWHKANLQAILPE